jgi:dCMP deaminase
MRPSIDKTMLEVAAALAKRSTCLKAAVGCVLTDKHGRILAAGYNGVAKNQRHCNEGFPCAGHDLPPGSETCQAIHAEVNAIIQCRDPDAIHTVYCTAEPCFRCTKDLLNTGATRVVFTNIYGPEPQAGALWRSAGREWIKARP